MNTNFSQQQRNAVERMREMNSRSTNPPEPKENSKPTKQNSQASRNSLFSDMKIPFLTEMQKDGDLTLILGILLLLLSEKADKRLLFALIYILL